MEIPWSDNNACVMSVKVQTHDLWPLQHQGNKVQPNIVTQI